MSSEQVFAELLSIIQRLRDPENGCPWDLKQTHESLKPYLLEEAYEVLEAIDFQRDELPGELGDVLLQVVLHAQIAADEKKFTIEDVMKLLNDKLIRRHPHIFADTVAKTAEEVKKNWDKIKSNEKDTKASLADRLSHSAPSLSLASEIGKSTGDVGFDWTNPAEVLQKVDEELDEVKEALEHDDRLHLEEELGDLLFTVAQLVRHAGFDPETTLVRANQKFIRRFQALEAQAGRPLSELSFEELHEFWDQIKAGEASKKGDSAAEE